MVHPYSELPPQAFWRSGVAKSNPARIAAVFEPKFSVGMDDAIATAGSCFAQYIGRRLRRAGLNVLDAEPAPRAAAEAVARDFGYGIYSARYGNIYSARHFVQLLRDALTDFVDPAYVWDRHGRYFDALRPVIEPDGFVSVDEALAMRRIHLAAVRSVFSRATCVFFTLGLTECWVERRTGRVFPTCPGVVAGHFDPALYEFVSLGHDDVLADLAELRDTLKALHPAGRLILSVSPVPLTATVSGQHVLVATNQSKAVLRVAAGAFAAGHADVDYFPSYEIVNNPAAMGSFFRPNLRDVSDRGVDAVMAAFFAAQGLRDPDGAPAPWLGGEEIDGDPPDCEEILKEAFAR